MDLSHLVVWDRLEVGPALIEPTRIVTPYTVVRGEQRVTIEHVYRYEGPILDATDPVCRNLAALAGAQIALNYGLFAGAIVLRGPFDAVDRAWLREMADNTATEIYVNKLLAPNPFLVGLQVPLVRRDSYLQAELVFPDPEPELPRRAWAEGGDAVAVLSSGGKDSLLSQGLLEEAGCDVHPLFVNESGRHWFTALNGYRYDKATRPHTARVWTNSDRVFAFLLRQLPFVREDFARMRADMYPIRLWTVAVFLFGVLPLCHRRGVGRIVIGDEHDTSVRAEHEGIPHYAGLYDQSRWFDERLTKLYADKGWAVDQLSLLRPCSELLIERILAERYRDLLRQQTSCHATHAEGGRVRPCGRCEKCRRIVGMLVAHGIDPQEVGYSEAQVRRALADLAAHGVHQDPIDAAHLAFLLVAQGHVAADSPFGRHAACHPEVLQLRFDPERSPVEVYPPDLRDRVLEHLLRDTDAVRLVDGRWEPYDPVPRQAFEVPTVGDPLREGQAPWRLGELTYPQAQRRFAEVDVALLPVGAVEQHGPHLPLDIDAYDAAWQAEQVAAACSDPKPLVLPLIPYGVSYHHADFAGTLSVEPQTLARLVYEVGMGVARNGVRKLVIVNGHGGNVPALQYAAQMINRDAHIFTCVDTGESSDAEISALVGTSNDVHAGEIETSTALVNRPHLVDMSKAAAAVPHFSSRYLEFGSSVGVAWFARTSKISPSGVLGDPTLASAEKGEAIWSITIRHLVALVEYLKRTPLEELHRRRE